MTRKNVGLVALLVGLLALLSLLEQTPPVPSATRTTGAAAAPRRPDRPPRNVPEAHADDQDIGLSVADTDAITVDSWAEHARDVSERMNGGVVTCTVGPSIPDGSVDVTLEGELPPEFPRTERTLVIDGHVALSVPPGTGTARLEVREVTIGQVRWEGAKTGAIIECSNYTTLADLVAVYGRVVDTSSRPAGRAMVEGCDTYAYADESTGEFVAYVAPGSCTLRAVLRQNMGRSEGPAVALTAARGRDLYDVLLIAPDEPEWRDGTAEETKKSRAENCEYWTGVGSRAVALVESIAAKQEPGTAAYEEWQGRLQERRDLSNETNRAWCDDE